MRCLGTSSCSVVITRPQEPDFLDKKLKTALEVLQINKWTGEQLKQIATEEQESVVNVVSTDRKYGKHATRNDTKTHTGTRNSSLLALCRYCHGKHVSDRNKCP